MNSVFLSYARDDDEAFVRRLYADLTSAGFTVWFDRESLLSRGLSFHQEIKDAIRNAVDRVVYIGGPKAASSAYVREEWQFALECDHVVVTPIRRIGDVENVPGELSQLHCEDFRDDEKYGAALEKLIASLREPNPKLGALFGVPSLPPNFLGRPDLMARVRDALLVDLQKPQVITGADARVGMQGMGGIGKSVLAAALARNRQIREAYPDGVIWIACGRKLSDEDLVKRQRDVARHLGGDDTFASLVQGQGVLRELLAAKAALFVLDDVWRAADAQAFDVLGPRGRMLVTTRDSRILDSLHGELVPVSLFTETESLQLLAGAVRVVPAALPPEAHEVMRKCGCLPLALTLCGGMARKRSGDFHSVLERLRRADLEKISDREAINEQHRSIWIAMHASVEMLPEDEQHRFAELSVFATDQTVPEAAGVTLWAHSGDLNDLDAEDLLIDLAERSLVQLDEKTDDGGTVRRRFRLHDLLHDYAARVAGEPRAVHQKLLDAYRLKCKDGWPSGPDDGYFLQKLVTHLVAAEQIDDAVALLTDLPWIETKARVGLVFELQEDYRDVLAVLPEAQSLREEERRRKVEAARWTTEIIEYSRAWTERRARAERGEPIAEFEPKLPEAPVACRMWTDNEIEVECTRILATPTRLDRVTAFADFVRGACYPLLRFGKRPGFVVQHAWNAAPAGPVHEAAEQWLKPSQSTLLKRRWPPDAPTDLKPALLTTFEGHALSLTNVSVTPDGWRAVSASEDRTLRVWDLTSGACLRVLRGHTHWIQSVSATPDGARAVSASLDHTLRVWELSSGECLRVLKGHTAGVESVSVTPDGARAVSASHDGTVRLWDLTSGACLRVLVGPTQWVWCVSVTPDGARAVSASQDGTLRVWDLTSGACLQVLVGHTDLVRSVSVTLDGARVVSASQDRTLRVWDLEKGVCLQVLEGHIESVSTLGLTPDGARAVSAGHDRALRVWDLTSGVCLRVLEGHTAFRNVSVTPDGGCAVSAGYDRTLRVWNLTSIASPRLLERHKSAVTSVSTTAEGVRAVSASADGALRMWNLSSGVCLMELRGHTGLVSRVIVTPDGARAVSASSDLTLRVWDLTSGACLRVLAGHTGIVSSVSVTPDGTRAVSASEDRTLRVWNLASGACLKVLEGQAAWHVIATSDGARAVTSGLNRTLRVWDLTSGACLQVLDGHTDVVWNVSVTADGTRAVSASEDRTLRVWNLTSGECLLVLQGHTAEVRSVSVTPDGARAVSTCGDRTLRVWDLTSGACLQVLKGHTAEVSASVSLDGARIVSASTDRTLRVWDLASGACLAVETVDGYITSLAAHGDRICAGTTTGEVLFLDLVNG
jgi:WD40 repeat protein